MHGCETYEVLIRRLFSDAVIHQENVRQYTVKVKQPYTGLESSLGPLEDQTPRIFTISKMKVVMLLDSSIGRLYLPGATLVLISFRT
jgi:hypothetical protein